MDDNDELWTLARTLVRKSASDALAQGRDSDGLVDALRAELEVLGRRVGRTEDEFRAMILSEIETAVADHRSNAVRPIKTH